MRLSSRLPALATLLSVLLASITPTAGYARQQAAQPFEQFANRVRDALKLNERQVAEFRQILFKHEPRITELRRRAQASPYAPGLASEVQREQNAIRDELSAHLDDEQKGRLAGVDARLPVPLGPPFVLINIPPRVRMEAAGAKPLDLAGDERLIASPRAAIKGRVAQLTEEQKALHLLNRITFGPRPGDVERVRRMGPDKLLEEQLHPEGLDDSELEKRLAVLPTQQMTSSELYQFYPPPQVADQRASEKNPAPVFGRPQQVLGEMVQQKLVRAVSSNRQLQEVMTDFWFNHFNVFAQKEADQWLVAGYERDVIRPHALGKFRDLLLATAQSPAMLFYLDNWLSAAPEAKEPRPPAPPRPPGQPKEAAKPAPGADPATTPPAQARQTGPKPDGPAPPSPDPRQAAPARKRGINENYARELMELHTLGVEGGYTQKDVQEVARCLTGWTIDRPFQGGGFVFRPWMHDAGGKTVLGVSIPAGGGISDGERVIEILSRHPSTARFISGKLCQRFVSDDPPAQVVERAAQVFLKTGGDIREVLRTILTSPEFYSQSAFRSKVKSPLELAASAIRAVDGDTNGAPALHEWLRKMGEPLYQYAFPTGYGERSAAWVNAGVFFNRINFAAAFASDQIAGTGYDPARLISPERVADREGVTDRLAALVVHTELSADSRLAILDALGKQPAGPPRITTAGAGAMAEPDAARRRVIQVIGLLFATAEFQRR
ncbi:MAG: DUF1800 family protein [Blastocatellia bacterium]